MPLTQRGFLVAVVILVALNLFVYFWWMNWLMALFKVTNFTIQ